jgi:hypothetical protein
MGVGGGLPGIGRARRGIHPGAPRQQLQPLDAGRPPFPSRAGVVVFTGTGKGFVQAQRRLDRHPGSFDRLLDRPDRSALDKLSLKQCLPSIHLAAGDVVGPAQHPPHHRAIVPTDVGNDRIAPRVGRIVIKAEQQYLLRHPDAVPGEELLDRDKKSVRSTPGSASAAPRVPASRSGYDPAPANPPPR